MNTAHTRRGFLAQVGRGALLVTIGYEAATELGLSSAIASENTGTLSFGPLEPLVRLMQETPVDRLLPKLASELKGGTELRKLVAAAALANARTFGGEDYVGYHTMMALAPAFHMAQELDKEVQALPVFKVLYRNTDRIQQRGGRKEEVLDAVAPASEGSCSGESLRQIVRNKDTTAAERAFATIANKSAEDAFNNLLYAVHDNTEVHRIVLPYRAWDLLELIGKEHAHTLLRQSLRYCLQSERGQRSSQWDRPRTLLPDVFDKFKLMDRSPGTRAADDKAVEELSETFFKSTADEAASAAAAALVEGMSPAHVGEAISLAANQLVLRDAGRSPREESPGKPVGSVHGDSIGVHASDSANAWRNMARVGNTRNCFASLILGAYQVAHDRTNRGGDFQNWKPLPVERHLNEVKSTEAGPLLREAEEAIRGNLQAKAAAIVHRYGELGHPPRKVFDLLLRYAVSEDGSLHAEKYYRTVSEEFNSTRPAFRWRHLTALARVTASEFGRPAPGMAEARELLKA